MDTELVRYTPWTARHPIHTCVDAYIQIHTCVSVTHCDRLASELRMIPILGGIVVTSWYPIYKRIWYKCE